VYLERGLAEDSELLRHWQGEGIIARLRGSGVIHALERHDVPAIVDRPVSGRLKKRRAPLSTIHWMNGPEKMVADYFRNKGFRHFAFCPMEDGNSWERGTQFHAAVSQMGFQCQCHEPLRKFSSSISALQQRKHLEAWVKSLPRPVAIFAANDMRAYEIAGICAMNRISIPEEVAILGCDNDVALCELCDPPLSSVDAPLEQIGFQAAQELDCMMRDTAPVEQHAALDCWIVTRRSTDLIAIDDTVMQRALSLLYQKVPTGYSVKELVNEIGLPRRTLERLFLKTTGRTPGGEIRRLQLQRAKSLLTETSLSIDDIAHSAGVSSVTRLGELMRRHDNVTPSEYRRLYRQSRKNPEPPS
jgi:LacI family transcriptional regulator